MLQKIGENVDRYFYTLFVNALFKELNDGTREGSEGGQGIPQQTEGSKGGQETSHQTRPADLDPLHDKKETDQVPWNALEMEEITFGK